MEITIREFLDAMEKNGYTKARYSYIEYDINTDDRSVMVGACAYGQAALNLGIDPGVLHQAVQIFLDTRELSISAFDIVSLNDHTEMDVPEIARQARGIAEEHGWLDEKLYV